SDRHDQPLREHARMAVLCERLAVEHEVDKCDPLILELAERGRELLGEHLQAGTIALLDRVLLAGRAALDRDVTRAGYGHRERRGICVRRRPQVDLDLARRDAYADDLIAGELE